MTIRLQLPKVTELKPRITVIGIGGAGGNAVNNMIASGLTGVEFVVANTDAQALATSSADLRIQLGANLTEGLGAGSKPEIGQAAAEEAIEEIRAQIAGSHMVFIAAGMGGGTGTGAAAVVARIARDLGILVVAIVTKPFHFEGARRMRLAEAGVAELRRTVDTMIVIPNQNLFRVATERTTFAEAFVLADQVLYSGIACIVDLIVKEGLINLDFADVRTVLAGMGSAVMGTGEASGERRAVLAAEEAISNPLLDDVSLKGARGLLLSITGGRNLTLYEVDEAASRVRKEVDPDANIIVGATFDDSLQDRVRVSIVASGMDQQHGVEVPPLQPPLAQPVRAGAALHAAPVAHAPRDVDQGTTLPRPPAGPARAPLHQPDSGKQPPGATAPLMPHEPQSGYGEPLGLGHAPPRSQPVTATASGARAPSQRDAEDYARAMSDAYPIPTIGAPGSQDGRSDAAPARGAWESSDGVTIEEAMAPLAGAPSPPPLPPQRASRTGAQAADAGFTPQPPADPRRSKRRMPEIADFPEVGQRDYRAKSQDPAGHEASGRRRQGLFERLSSFARRESDDERAAAGRPQTRDDFETAHRDGKAAAGRRNGAAGADRGKSRDAQPPELPDFFDRKRR